MIIEGLGNVYQSFICQTRCMEVYGTAVEGLSSVFKLDSAHQATERCCRISGQLQNHGQVAFSDYDVILVSVVLKVS